MQESDRLARLRRLTRREVEVLTAVCEGHSYGQVGAVLFVSERTVQFHMRNILDKLELLELPPAARQRELGTVCPLLPQLSDSDIQGEDEQEPAADQAVLTPRDLVVVREVEPALVAQVRELPVRWDEPIPEPPVMHVQLPAAVQRGRSWLVGPSLLVAGLVVGGAVTALIIGGSRQTSSGPGTGAVATPEPTRSIAVPGGPTVIPVASLTPPPTATAVPTLNKAFVFTSLEGSNSNDATAVQTAPQLSLILRSVRPVAGNRLNLDLSFWNQSSTLQGIDAGPGGSLDPQADVYAVDAAGTAFKGAAFNYSAKAGERYDFSVVLTGTSAPVGPLTLHATTHHQKLGPFGLWMHWADLKADLPQ